jgi:hypothetical protein
MKNQTPVITVTEFEANRLTFEAKGRTYIYDARGYEFAHYPKTGKILTEPKDSVLMDIGILFRAYEDIGEKHFAFCHEDCFDPAMYLVCADSFETAYDIFLDEFAQPCEPHEYPTEELLEEAVNGGIVSHTSGGRLVYSENVQGFELKLVKAENL